MADETKQSSEQQTQLSKKDEEIKHLMEQHPEETMSQVENRYGEGREKSGSSGTLTDAIPNGH